MNSRRWRTARQIAPGTQSRPTCRDISSCSIRQYGLLTRWTKVPDGKLRRTGCAPNLTPTMPVRAVALREPKLPARSWVMTEIAEAARLSLPEIMCGECCADPAGRNASETAAGFIFLEARTRRCTLTFFTQRQRQCPRCRSLRHLMTKGTALLASSSKRCQHMGRRPDAREKEPNSMSV
jgi:hypothetical protein